MCQRKGPNPTVESLVWHLEAERYAGLLDDPVPALDARGRVADIVVAQFLVERVQRRCLRRHQPAVAHLQHRIRCRVQQMIVVDLGLVESSFEACRVKRGGVRRNVGAEQVHRDTEVEVEITLHGRQVDDSERTHRYRIVDLVRDHRFAGALDHPGRARLTDEHVVRFLSQHEPACACQRIEARFGQRAQLVLAVAVGEVGEHEERQPIGRRLVKRAEDARIVGIAGAALEQRLRFLAAVAAEVGLQQIHHRPEVATFLDVDLEQVPQIV